MKTKILFIIKADVPPFQFVLRDGNCFFRLFLCLERYLYPNIAGVVGVLTGPFHFNGHLEEPRFHALNLVSALNSDSLSLNLGHPC